MLVAGTVFGLSFPQTPRGGAVRGFLRIPKTVFNTGVNAPKRRLMPVEQRLMPLESFSQLKGMKVNAFSEDFA